VKKHVLLDTGPLVALIDVRNAHHQWAVVQWGDIEPPLMTCESVISEACFLLDQTRAGSAAVFEMLMRKAIVLSFRLDEHLEDVQRLREKYSNVPMSVADASLVRMTEQFRHSAVLTLDTAFKVYRKPGRHVIPLILPAKSARSLASRRVV
jgi:predicted nucleic acid-binding protein